MEEARCRLEQGPYSAYPLVEDDGRYVGSVSQSDLPRHVPEFGAPVVEVASGDVVSVSPDVTVLEALYRILVEGIEHLPVTEEGRLVGI